MTGNKFNFVVDFVQLEERLNRTMEGTVVKLTDDISRRWLDVGKVKEGNDKDLLVTRTSCFIYDGAQ